MAGFVGRAVGPVVGVAIIATVCSCQATTGGTAEQAEPAATSSVAAGTSAEPAATTEASRSEATTSPDFALPDYGVLPTTERPLAPGEVTCDFSTPPPGGTVEAATGDATSPTVTVGVPDGFTRDPASNRDRVQLTGPDGLTATVTIAPTTQEPGAAFDDYSDRRTADFSISSVSVLPGDMCGYSGQEQMGTLAEKPGESIEYADRIVHIWTGAAEYLVAVTLQAPGGAPGFDTAKSVLQDDFRVQMPG